MKNFINIVSIVVCFLCGLSVAHANKQSEQVAIQKAWVRAVPSGAISSAAFMELYNEGKESVIVSILSDSFSSAEIHENVIDGGVMSMKKLRALILPEKKAVKLAPNGIHIMLIAPQKKIEEGDLVNLTLVFSDNSEKDISVVIRKE